MQNPILSVQVQTSSTSPAPAPKAGLNADSAEHDFQRTLSRQMEQRTSEQRANNASHTAARPAAPDSRQAQANQAAQAKQAQANQAQAKQAQADANQTRQPQAADQTAAAGPADGKTEDKVAATDDTQDGSAGGAVSGPVADMLALVASFNPAIARPAAAGDAASPATAGSKGGPARLTTLAAAAAGAGKPKTAAAPDSAADGTADSAAAALPDAGATATKGPLDFAHMVAARDAATPLVSAREPLRGEAGGAAAIVAPLAQASAQVVQSASAIPVDKLNGRVGTPAWDQELGQKVVWMVAGGEQSASLTLNPPDLGPLQVVLSVSNNHADASFTAAQPEVRQALEAAMPRLREMLGEAGITLGQASVSAGSSGQQSNTDGQGGSGSGGGRARQDSGDDGSVRRAATVTRVATPGMVDTFA